ncbi:interaptin [Vigna radiata var. radiata]|uniref:Interaptin n=1 Tax=Vigna radiata var. radiata TaxID=3916 RepID=A0A1S3T7M6_VIGRR|nr:interaptin [Vigna radiata var. radiata]
MKVEIEGSQSDSAESQGVSGTDESVSSQSENRRLESKKKLKKVRSIRLVRLPSKRSSIRGRPQYDHLSILSSVSTENLEGVTPLDMADASPHYMKGTSSSHAKDSVQNTERLLFTKKTLGRMSTLKLKRSLTRKVSGRTEPKRKVKSSRSIMLVTVKGQKSSESSYGSGASDAADNKTQRVITRRLSLKPVRILAKIPTFKSKNSSMESGQSLDTSLLRATCSSALKDSHFPDLIDFPQEESDSQRVSAVAKVCPYSYCSLHGHRHGNLPPLKRFVSMRRRKSKSQKPTKMDNQPVTRSNQFGNAKKGTRKTQTVHSEDDKSHFQNKKKLARDSCIRPHDTPEFTVTESVEPVSTDGVQFSAPDIEMLEGEVTNTGKNMEPDHEVLEVSSVPKESTHASTTDLACGMQERDKKHINMWHLVYKHAVLSNTGKCENKQPFDGGDKEGREQGFLTTNEVNNSNCREDCDTDQDMDDENKNVIELVQKAFDEILLPEPEELFSDDNSKSEGADSDEVLLEKNDGQTEWKTSESTESPIAQRMETKSDQRAPKSWSNLKKLILWKRFVKALEKVRNIHPQRPRRFPSDANFEMEKVFLKHQTAEEKKHAEEWMLDYALQKVISKLAPAQRRRVTLLVEAFETVQPFQDVENSTRLSLTTEHQSNLIQSLENSSNHSKEEASLSHKSTMELAVSTGDDPMIEMHSPIMLKERCVDYTETEAVNNMPVFRDIEEDLNGKESLARSYDNEKLSSDNDNIFLVEVKDTRSSSLNKPIEFTSSHVEESTKAVVNDVSEDLLSSLNTENRHIKSESPGRDVETKNLIGDNGEKLSMSKSLIVEGLVRSLRSNLIGSGAPAKLLDESSVDGKEGTKKVKLETETVEEFPTKEQSKAPKSASVEPETPVEKQNNTGLWFLVYKHMVSNMAESNSKSLIDGEDEKESAFDGSTTRGSSISYEGTTVSNQEMQFKDHAAADPEVALQQIEAIKMVEEAIDSILPDDQDDLADKESLTGSTISDNSKQSDRTERVYSEDLNQKEEKMESGNEILQEQQKESAELKEQCKKNQPLSRSWSNLKKVILLRRFIKSLEKVRKFNPRGPRYLPLEPDSEAEKVNLRHQDMEERKGTEEWMLDYALRQVVSKLTPARKRKVELLVEAFETVMPTITK